MRLKFAALSVFLIGLSSFAFALNVPERPEGRVSDYAGMISPSARQILETTLAQFEQETSNQVVVVTFPSLEEESLEDFSIRLAEKWKIGQKGKDNGVIFLIFKNDRKMRIEVGYGLEGALPDLTAGIILDQIVKPRFREGKFDEGIIEGVQAIIQATKGEFKAVKKQEDVGSIFFPILVFLVALYIIWQAIRGGGNYRSNRYQRKWGESGSGWIGGGSMGGSSSGGGGGFGGGGGGFGGGGSSGGW